MLKAVCQAFGICCGNAEPGEGDIRLRGHFRCILCCLGCRCACDASKHDAVGARQTADAVGAVHAACSLAAGIETRNAGRSRLINLDTTISGVGIHRHAHLVGRRDAVLVLQPGGKGLHKLRDVLAGEVVVERQALCTCLIDGKIDGAGGQA